MSPLLIALCAVCGVSLVGVFLHHQNNHITLTRFTKTSPRVKHGFRIVHLSDLHDKQFYRDKLFRQVADLHPDIILFTGDIISRWTTDRSNMRRTLRALCQIAPVYFVPGNHEYGQIHFEEVFGEIRACGAVVLRHQLAELRLHGDRVTLLGLDEVGYFVKTPAMLRRLEKSPHFRLLMSHYSDYTPDYLGYDIDLGFVGHSHGGQFRLPFIGGLYASSQGIFPKYAEGLRSSGGATVAISRGLGNSRFPFRLFNYPEIIVADVAPQESKKASQP